MRNRPNYRPARELSEDSPPGLRTLPRGWVWAKLAKLAEVKLGKMLSSKVDQAGLLQLPYVRNENVRWGHVDTSDLKRMGFKRSEVERYELRPGDVLVCEGGEAGRTAIFTGYEAPLMFQKAVHRVRADPSLLDSRFFRYYMEYETSARTVLPSLSETTIPHLTLEKLRTLLVPLPPLHEQQRIVAAIDSNFATLDAGLKSILEAERKLEIYRRSLLFRAFDQLASKGSGRAVARRLATVSKSIEYGYTTSASKISSGPRLLRITDIQDGTVDWSTVPGCDISGQLETKFTLQDGDILFARTGATTGKSYLVSKPPRAIFASYLIRVRPGKELWPRYLAYFFQSPQYWQQINQQKVGIGQPNVNGSRLGQLEVPVLSLEKQRQVVEKLDGLLQATYTTRSYCLSARAKLSGLRKTILRAAFLGQLTAGREELSQMTSSRFPRSELGSPPLPGNLLRS